MTKNPMRRVPLSAARWTVLALILAVAVAPLRAQNPQQTQTIAELRILTDMTQQLQKSVNELSDAVKDLKEQVKSNGQRLDNQATQLSAMAATQKTLFDSLTTTLANLENKVNENSMNTQRLFSEVTAVQKTLSDLVDTIQSLSQAQPAAPPAGAPTPGGTAAGNPPATSISADSPTQMYQDAFGFYSRGEYDLARKAFQEFIDKFPTSPDAPSAQYQIAMSFKNEADVAQDPAQRASRYNDAIAAFTEVVTKYKDCGCEPEADAYIERGLSYRAVKQEAKAKEDFLKVQSEYTKTKSPAWENANALAAQALKGK